MFRPPVLRLGRLLVALGSVALLAACNESRPTVPSLSASLTGPSASVGQSGAFLHNPEPSAHPEISPASAQQLAEAWAHEFAPLTKSYWEHDRGGPIDFRDLRPCGSNTYVATPFSDPGPNVPAAVRRAVGPWWLVTLCAAGVPEISVAVSAWDTALKIENGHLLNLTGDDFLPMAIPLTLQYKDVFLITAQQAVDRAQQVTQRLAAGPPELVMQPFVMPQFADWRVPLDSTATVHLLSDGSFARRNEVYVGPYAPQHDGGVSVAKGPGQSRATIQLRYYSRSGSQTSVTVSVRPGYSIDTEVAARATASSK